MADFEAAIERARGQFRENQFLEGLEALRGICQNNGLAHFNIQIDALVGQFYRLQEHNNFGVIPLGDVTFNQIRVGCLNLTQNILFVGSRETKEKIMSAQKSEASASIRCIIDEDFRNNKRGWVTKGAIGTQIRDRRLFLASAAKENLNVALINAPVASDFPYAIVVKFSSVVGQEFYHSPFGVANNYAGRVGLIWGAANDTINSKHFFICDFDQRDIWYGDHFQNNYMGGESLKMKATDFSTRSIELMVKNINGVTSMLVNGMTVFNHESSPFYGDRMGVCVGGISKIAFHYFRVYNQLV